MSDRTYPCPACDGELTARNSSPDAWLFCERNGGLALRDAALRKKFGDGLADRMWKTAADAPHDALRDCPGCHVKMVAFRLADAHPNVLRVYGGLLSRGGASVELDACPACKLVWFDPLELNDAEFIATDPNAAMVGFYIAMMPWFF